MLVGGTYFINRYFATVELIDKTIIDVGYVGVVVSYIGPKGVDSTGVDYKHGELVEKGYRGVWGEPLMPGKYAFNIYTQQEKAAGKEKELREAESKVMQQKLLTESDINIQIQSNVGKNNNRTVMNVKRTCQINWQVL